MRGLLILLLLVAPAAAQPRTADPDWPCAQRLVPSIGAGALWPGPAPEGDWRAEPAVAALVARIAPRPVPEAEGVAAIEGFAAPLDPAARRRLLPLAFAGLLEEANRQRGTLIEQIRRFTRHQREVAERVRGLEAELRAMPETDPARPELEQRHAFAARIFTEAERTVRYVCEAPVQVEARLGAYARALQAAMPRE